MPRATWLVNFRCPRLPFVRSQSAAGAGEGGKAETRTESPQASVRGARSAHVHGRPRFSPPTRDVVPTHLCAAGKFSDPRPAGLTGPFPSVAGLRAEPERGPVVRRGGGRAGQRPRTAAQDGPSPRLQACALLRRENSEAGRGSGGRPLGPGRQRGGRFAGPGGPRARRRASLWRAQPAPRRPRQLSPSGEGLAGLVPCWASVSGPPDSPPNSRVPLRCPPLSSAPPTGSLGQALHATSTKIQVFEESQVPPGPQGSHL